MHACEVFRLCLAFLAVLGARQANAKLKYKVNCTEERVVVKIEKPDSLSKIYLDNLKYLTEIGCQPTYDGGKAVFNLSLVNFSLCGINRISHQATGTKIFYHRIIVEFDEQLEHKEILNFKCIFPGTATYNATRTRREVLPAGFKEQEDIESITTVETNAPEPMLNVTVKQGSSRVNGELNVKPGTPLSMEISLDEKSAPIYGLLVSYMQVSDTKSQEETIIYNGCSLDPYLFENFNTVDGDFLAAKFRAFKFPETTYVQFTGTVSICLDKCRGIECSNGQIGYGRRKREISGIPYDPKKVFEVTLTTFLKVDYKDAKDYPDTVFRKKRLLKEKESVRDVLKLNEYHAIIIEDLMDEASKEDEASDSINHSPTTFKSSFSFFLSLTAATLTLIST